MNCFVLAAVVATGLVSGRVRAGVILNPGDLVVSDQESQGGELYDGALVRVNPANGAQTLISSGGLLNDPVGVAIDAHGILYVADFNSGGGALLRIDPLTGDQSIATAANLPGPPRGVTIGPDGQVYVTCDNSQVVKVDPATGAQSTVTSGDRLLVPEQLAFDATGKLFVVDAQGGGPVNGGPSGSVVGVNVADGSQSAVSAGGLHLAVGMVVEPTGTLLVSDIPAIPGSGDPARIVRLDPTTGDVTPLVVGGALSKPDEMAIDAAGRLIVADLGAGAVEAVDRSTGAISGISGGGFLNTPSGVAVYVPEPASLASLAAASLLLIRRRSHAGRPRMGAKDVVKPSTFDGVFVGGSTLSSDSGDL